MPEIFDNINDLAEMEQANVKEGWEPPVVNPPSIQNNGWPQWDPEVMVDENDVPNIVQGANAIVLQAMAQHPNQPQSSSSVSS